ncbi:MAG: hypothetical protein LBJ62_07340 [Bifidobacteriaceae bacterium]|nr:hypothetical protein [Bifidobacteriaceae bacterium]
MTTSAYPEIRAAGELSRNEWLRDYAKRILGKDASQVGGIVQCPFRLGLAGSTCCDGGIVQLRQGWTGRCRP